MYILIHLSLNLEFPFNSTNKALSRSCRPREQEIRTGSCGWTKTVSASSLESP